MNYGLHSLKRSGPRKAKRVGRGQSSGRGKTAGRGTKGQNARAGHKKRPELRDIIKKLPKRRGYGKNRADTVDNARAHAIVISLEKLERSFESGETVSRATLVNKGVIGIRDMNMPIKILGGSTLSKKLTIDHIPASVSAKAAIEKAGGSFA